jgi:hypothetical protein
MPLTVDYGLAAGAGVPIVIGLGAIVVRAIGAEDSLHTRYSERQKQTRSTLSADCVLPTLGWILISVHSLIDWQQIDASTEGGPDDSIDMVSDALQRRQFNDRLGDLSGFGADDKNLSGIIDDIKRMRHGQGYLMVPLFLGAGYLIFWAAETGIALPVPLTIVALVVTVAALTSFVTISVEDLLLANRLTRLFKKYP